MHNSSGYNKIPAITFSFWIMKICATTLGETAGDLLSMTMNIGYAISSIILLSFFFSTLLAQLSTKKYHPVIYWSVILSTSMAGTTMSDYMDRTLNLGYASGSLILVSLLSLTLITWRLKEKSLSVSNIKTRSGEIFYWTAILFSNTLGTALGDFITENPNISFSTGVMMIGSVISLIILAYYFTKISHVLLFWLAFVLTRPFGANLGDLLTKPTSQGGLNLGTIGTSIVLLIILAILVIVSTINLIKEHRPFNRHT